MHHVQLSRPFLERIPPLLLLTLNQKFNDLFIVDPFPAPPPFQHILGACNITEHELAGLKMDCAKIWQVMVNLLLYHSF